MSTTTLSAPLGQVQPTEGRLVRLPAKELQPHPSMVRLQLVPTARDLSVAVNRREQDFHDPIVISSDHSILSGQSRWLLASKQGNECVDCLQLDIRGDEALLWMIQKHQRSSSLNDFNRITLALELEPWFKQKARCNQQAGGKGKGSSNLTEADRVDVREQVAKAAGVSVGNVSKVKDLVADPCPDAIEALRIGEISIHRAWGWLHRPERMRDALRLYRDRHGIKRVIEQLQTNHDSTGHSPNSALDPAKIAKAILAMAPNEMRSVLVGQLPTKGRTLMLSTELLVLFERQGRFDEI